MKERAAGRTILLIGSLTTSVSENRRDAISDPAPP